VTEEVLMEVVAPIVIMVVFVLSQATREVSSSANKASKAGLIH
jgi:hypothetical protein